MGAVMAEKCKLCGKDLPPDTDSPFCEECDEMLDKRFDKIEEDIVVYKYLTDEEIEILKYFDTEDILDLYASTYTRFAQEGQITEKEEALLKKIKDTFNLSDKDIENKLELYEKLGKEICPRCQKPINKDFNLCPYCGYKLNKDFEPKGDTKSGYTSYQETLAPMVKNTGCIIVFALILIAIIVYFIYRIVSS
jgi:predicted amidophosphoribosyltransferase